MEIIYNWVISQMDEKPQEGSLLDVVTCVHWRRNATIEINGKIYFADVYGAMQCGQPSPTDFTAYPDLTFEQVCSWLNEGLDVAALDANLYNQIENLVNPPLINLPLPWAPTTTTTTEAPL